MNPEKRANQIVPVVVCFGAIAISTWSIMWVLMVYGGLPWYIAILGSSAFDGIAIYASLQSARNTRLRGQAGFFPRLAILVFGGFSSWINYEHGSLNHSHQVISYILAAISFSAITGVELWLGSLKRINQRTKITIPDIRMSSRFLYPIRSTRLTRRLHGNYLDSLEKVKDTSIEDNSPVISRKDSALVRLWAQGKGIKVSDTGRIAQSVYDDYDLDMIGSNGVNHD